MAKIILSKTNKQLPDKKFISISKAAKFLQISPDTLRNWERQGKLIPARTFGGARRYSTAELLSLKKEIHPISTPRKGLLSVSQAAQALYVSKDTIRNWDAQGFIDSKRTKGGARRFTRAEIIRLQKELGIQEQLSDKAAFKLAKKVPNSELKFHNFSRFWFGILSTTTLAIIILTAVFFIKSYLDFEDGKLKEPLKMIEVLSKNLESMQKGVLGIQTQLLSTPAASPSPVKQPVIFSSPTGLVINSAASPITISSSNGQIGCTTCLTISSAYLTTVTNSDGTLSMATSDKTVTVSLSLDHSNSWSSPQSFNGGLTQSYNDSTTTPGSFTPASFSANLLGSFAGGETNLFGIKSSASIPAASSAGEQKSYGGYFTANGENTGAASSFAIGIYASAKGADNNFAAIFDNGNVGIGTTIPTAGKLVISQDASNTNPALYIDTEQSISTQPVFSIESNTTNGSGENTVKFKITADGSVYSDSGIFSSPADLAEMYPVKVDVEEANVVELTYEGGTAKGYILQRATSGSGNKLFGVISTKPGLVLAYDSKTGQKPVALAGRVPVSVSDENGPIEIGDYLTSSSIPGVAMKATKAGVVIGQALEPFDSLSKDATVSALETSHVINIKANIGRILTLIKVSYADPANFFASLSLDSDGNLVVPKIKAGSITLDSSVASASAQLSPNNTYLSLNTGPNYNSTTASTQNSTNTFYDLAGKVASLEQRIADLEQTVDQAKNLASAPSATGSSQLTNGQVASSSASPSANLASVSTTEASQSAAAKLNLTPPDILMASQSASLASLTVTDTLSSDKLFTAEDGKISGNLSVFGKTTLASTTIAGDLTVDGTFSISQNSINVAGITCHPESSSGSIKWIPDQVGNDNGCGILFLQNSPLAQGVDILNGLVTIDKKGNLKAQSVTVSEFRVVANKISGSGKISSGAKSVDIENTQVMKNSRILITPTSETNLVLAVTDKVEGKKFIVSAPQIVAADLNFDWFMITESSN